MNRSIHACIHGCKIVVWERESDRDWKLEIEVKEAMDHSIREGGKEMEIERRAWR